MTYLRNLWAWLGGVTITIRWPRDREDWCDEYYGAHRW